MPTGMCNTLTQIPSQELNLTEVFLLDASTADNPSEKRKGEWKDVSDKATKPGLLNTAQRAKVADSQHIEYRVCLDETRRIPVY